MCIIGTVSQCKWENQINLVLYIKRSIPPKSVSQSLFTKSLLCQYNFFFILGFIEFGRLSVTGYRMVFRISDLWSHQESSFLKKWERLRWAIVKWAQNQSLAIPYVTCRTLLYGHLWLSCNLLINILLIRLPGFLCKMIDLTKTVYPFAKVTDRNCGKLGKTVWKAIFLESELFFQKWLIVLTNAIFNWLVELVIQC